MSNEENKKLLKILGASGIMAGLFLPGVIIQIPFTGWFPEYSLNQGTMGQWLSLISQNQILTLFGIGLSVIAIIAFSVFGISLYSVIPNKNYLKPLALAFHISGVGLALVAFTITFGFTWEIINIQNVENLTNSLKQISSILMRGFLVCDDLATSLIGISNGIFGMVAYNEKLIPKWLRNWSIVGAVLVSIVLLRYLSPVFEFASIGYPIVILWFVFSGMYFFKSSNKI